MQIDARKFDHRARTVFKPVYPLIAGQILEYTGIDQGICLDIGCGGGYLGLALARQSGLYIRFVDQNQEMLAIARQNLREEGLTDRADTVLANVESIPLPDNSAQLAVSRGSVFFWEDHAAAFGEIHRVLAPGGMSYIGGGFGSASLKEEIGRKLAVADGDPNTWRDLVKRNMGPEMLEKFKNGLKSAGVPHDLLRDREKGLWIVIRKAV